MNPYLCAFLLYGVLIVPVRLAGAVRVGRRTGYRLTLRVIGVPVLSRSVRFDMERGRFRANQQKGFSRKKSEQSAPEALGGAHETVLRLLLSPAFRTALKRAVRVRRFRVEARVAFADAKRTALCYAAFRAALTTLKHVGSGPSVVHTALQADFSGHGGSFSASGIIRARMGMLTYAAAVLACLALRERIAKGKAARREEGYAASH